MDRTEQKTIRHETEKGGMAVLSTAKSACFLQAYKMPPAQPQVTKNLSRNYLTFKLSGTTTYVQGDHRVTTTPGKLIYIPAGASFETEIPEPGEYIELWYSSDPPEDTTIKIYSDFSENEMKMLFSKAVSYWAVKDDTAWFNCQAQLNLIFAHVAHSYGEYISLSMRQKLSPALNYMTENLFNPGFSINEMQEIVNMSDKYFRKLFVAVFHMTPQRYVITERINFARAIMLENPNVTIQQVAEAVGYNDPFYFSRLFKKEMGMSPTNYQKLQSKNLLNKTDMGLTK